MMAAMCLGIIGIAVLCVTTPAVVEQHPKAFLSGSVAFFVCVGLSVRTYLRLSGADAAEFRNHIQTHPVGRAAYASVICLVLYRLWSLTNQK